jgi:hypothetical protein
MKLENAREAYEAFSGKASDIVRQLSLAGIALVWLFKSGSATAPILERELVRVALFIFLALLCDFLQYLGATTIWIIYFRYKEKQGSKGDDEFLAPPEINWLGWGLFYLKSVALLLAYALYIIPFLISKFHLT